MDLPFEKQWGEKKKFRTADVTCCLVEVNAGHVSYGPVLHSPEEVKVLVWSRSNGVQHRRKGPGSPSLMGDVK